MTRNARQFAALLLFSFLLAGCGKPAMKPFASEDLRQHDSLTAALMPFDNLTNEANAGKTMENLVLVEFLRNARVSFIDPGEVNAALLEQRIRVTTSIPNAAVKALGERLGVEYLVQGVVHEYAMQRVTAAGGAGEVPAISLSIRIISTRTGEIAWAMSDSRRGNDRESLFGIGRVEAIEQLAQQTVEEMAQRLTESLKK